LGEENAKVNHDGTEFSQGHFLLLLSPFTILSVNFIHHFTGNAALSVMGPKTGALNPKLCAHQSSSIVFRKVDKNLLQHNTFRPPGASERELAWL